MTQNLLTDLNPAQAEAVTWDAKPLLILAGAGSGKTRILTSRIAHLINQGAPAFQILGVTFTNKAASEMKYRVSRLVNQDVWISTFHSTCMRILRMDGPAIEIDRNFTIYDDSDQKVIIKECMKDLGINDKQVHPKGVKERISGAKDLMITPFQYAEKSIDLYDETVAKIYKLYEEKLRKLQGLDFGDLIMKTVHLFDTKRDVLRTWQDRFQHILIDEYQDTNHSQYRLVKLLAAAKRQITVVGDPDQSIYAWRGADIHNILNFEKDYPECGVIRMEQNYRSTQLILDAANEIIKRNNVRKPKALWTEKAGGEKIALVECMNEKAEAEHIAEEALRHQREGRTLADQVVFYRVHAQSRAIEDALRRHNIPYKIVGGVKFYDRKEIKDLIAYLRVLMNPRDDVSLKRIINVPARGVGKKGLETIETVARERKCSVSEALDYLEHIKITPKAKKALGPFHKMMKSLREDSGDLSVREILERILDGTKYVELLEAEKSIEAQSRIENIEEFFSVIEDFEENDRNGTITITSPMPTNDGDFSTRPADSLEMTGEGGNKEKDAGNVGARLASPTSVDDLSSSKPGEASRAPTDENNTGNDRDDENVVETTPLQRFLETISLVTDLDTWDGGTDVFTLMSLHTAKGLEFPIVYLTGLEEGIFPHANSYTNDPMDLEEERRLCYVGITRSKEILTMLYARERRMYGATQHNLPSRFLNEIPSELFKRAAQSAGGPAPLKQWYGLSTSSHADDDDIFDDIFDDDNVIDL